MAVTLSDTCRSSVVPPVGFEPTPPPPEAGRCRDRRGSWTSYLGFLFASCVSGEPLCAVVRSTRHSTPVSSVDDFETLVLREVA
jgi:hypothetical protein